MITVIVGVAVVAGGIDASVVAVTGGLGPMVLMVVVGVWMVLAVGVWVGLRRGSRV